MNNFSISHNRNDENFEAKAKWFQSLSIEERIETFCNFTDLIINLNPKIIEQKYAEPINRTFQIFELK